MGNVFDKMGGDVGGCNEWDFFISRMNSIEWAMKHSHEDYKKAHESVGKASEELMKALKDSGNERAYNLVSNLEDFTTRRETLICEALYLTGFFDAIDITQRVNKYRPIRESCFVQSA